MINKKAKKYFIPNEENEFKPLFLRGKNVLFIILFILFLNFFALFFLTPIFSGKIDNLAAVLPSVLVLKANEERKNIGENEFIVNEKLVLAAQMKADDMAKKGYFSHISPEGKDPWYWFDKAQYKYEIAGENLAVNFVDSNDVHNAWMNSPTHKENIIRQGFTEIGIATSKGEYKGKKAVFVAQYFAKPKEENNLSKNTGLLYEFNSQETYDSETELENQLFTSDQNQEVLGVQTKSINEKPSFWEKIQSSPKTLITYVLYFISLIVIISIILKIFVKVKIQYPVLILNGLLILLIIILILYLNELITVYSAKI